ncbi:hypothetical protein [Actinokineospora xionganensis]|uniref:Low temperature requirement A protein (LtrA) n=1 Tax=Actinokineospora xionganensis TaxID=2684470 RepID=A0ABR7KZM9_9PSEU|nr:hypothetical protein [Actinokineospora xionganensis]MBC6445892.1 hypothetical protein [Actinokineospora xionganensis]
MAVTWRDGASSALVAVIVVSYTWYQNTGSLLFVRDARGMAVVGLALGLTACVVGARVTDGHMPVARLVLGVLAMISGVLTLVVSAEWSLGLFMLTVITLWLTTTFRHISGRRSTLPSTEPADRVESER